MKKCPICKSKIASKQIAQKDDFNTACNYIFTCGAIFYRDEFQEFWAKNCPKLKLQGGK